MGISILLNAQKHTTPRNDNRAIHMEGGLHGLAKLAIGHSGVIIGYVLAMPAMMDGETLFLGCPDHQFASPMNMLVLICTVLAFSMKHWRASRHVLKVSENTSSLRSWQ
jgi:hypothetical protein